MSESVIPDLVITGGRVIDPASGFDGMANVAIADGMILGVGDHLQPVSTETTLDARGLLVVPGLIDIHAHVYRGMGLSLDPDLAGVLSGVTTIVDGGTAGPATWKLFHEHVILPAHTRTLAFLHIARTGQAFTPEIRIEDDIDLQATIACARAIPEVIPGIKLRAVGPGVTNLGSRMVELTRRAARESGGMQMIHIGDPDAGDGPTLTREVLASLDTGDILSHVFTDQPGSLLDDAGRITPEALEAQARGVIMEPSPGRLNFSFDAAKRLLDQGLRPDVLGTDLTAPGRGWLVYSLTEVMSQYLALGFSLPDVIRMTTAAPAKVLGLQHSIGALTAGYEADITLLKEERGKWLYYDRWGCIQRGETALAPVLTFRAGERIAPDWGPHPWGWLPQADPSAS